MSIHLPLDAILTGVLSRDNLEDMPLRKIVAFFYRCPSLFFYGPSDMILLMLNVYLENNAHLLCALRNLQLEFIRSRFAQLQNVTVLSSPGYF